MKLSYSSSPLKMGIILLWYEVPVYFSNRYTGCELEDETVYSIT